jgi:hypothetical protein
VFVRGKPIQPSKIFAGKVVAYLIEAYLACSTLWQAPDLTQKHKTKLKRPGNDKHSSLLGTFVYYGCEKLYNTDIVELTS